MAKKVLLLNPPGKKLYIRDYYCSKVSKSNYLFHPIDLLMPSGMLAERYETFLIDAIAQRLTQSECLAMIDIISPDVIISLIGAVSFKEDMEYLKGLAKEGRQIIVSGDAAMEEPAAWLNEHQFIDAVILDFASKEIAQFLTGELKGLSSIVHRNDDWASYRRPVNEEFSITVPKHELFAGIPYRFPFVKHRRFSTVLTAYGCPFKCSFCIIGTLGYRYRTVDNVMEELRYIKKLGTKEVFFYDQTFGINRKRCLEICNRIKGYGFGFGWVCFSRVDVLDEEFLKNMATSGCHTIIFGVESASSEILKKYQKGYTKEQIRETFGLCKKYNIRTVATFIIGLPEETWQTASETIEFLKEIDCDFASFNVAVPRNNTGLKKEAINTGLIDSQLETMDQTGSEIAMPTKFLSKEDVLSLKKKAVKDFYLRPKYLLKRLKSITSVYELKEQIYEGISMFRGL
ncbi:MAG: radical SAM protein [Candidatus Magnetoovum sp. WYHC-5]|nr:radical SAM protein [Candidatus Magnetoovum sp. WYHC-5]